jgi:hypothetical protein
MEQSIIQLAKDVGAIDHRLKTIETIVYNNYSDEPLEPDSKSPINYPITGKYIKDTPLTTDQYRMIMNSMINVDIIQEEKVVRVAMTRDEFEIYIKNDPSKRGELILKVTPEYEDYL